mmetsp:Transcript_66796/g.186375  ORF Transcript_66796/g.186375 Transcript_66796/m.186375 type:complete len:253 (+) Transcript_66796:632-1390(+)
MLSNVFHATVGVIGHVLEVVQMEKHTDARQSAPSRASGDEQAAAIRENVIIQGAVSRFGDHQLLARARQMHCRQWHHRQRHLCAYVSTRLRRRWRLRGRWADGLSVKVQPINASPSRSRAVAAGRSQRGPRRCPAFSNGPQASALLSPMPVPPLRGARRQCTLFSQEQRHEWQRGQQNGRRGRPRSPGATKARIGWPHRQQEPVRVSSQTRPRRRARVTRRKLSEAAVLHWCKPRRPSEVRTPHGWRLSDTG